MDDLRKLKTVVLIVIIRHLFAEVYFCMFDDLLLIAPYVCSYMLDLCETELSWLDMHKNVKNSVCINFGRHFNMHRVNLTTHSGDEPDWVRRLPLSWCILGEPALSQI